MQTWHCDAIEDMVNFELLQDLSYNLALIEMLRSRDMSVG